MCGVNTDVKAILTRAVRSNGPPNPQHQIRPPITHQKMLHDFQDLRSQQRLFCVASWPALCPTMLVRKNTVALGSEARSCQLTSGAHLPCPTFFQDLPQNHVTILQSMVGMSMAAKLQGTHVVAQLVTGVKH